MSLSYEPVSKKPPEPGQNRPRSFGTITIPGTPVGAIVSVGLVVICWFALPLSRPFLSAYSSTGNIAVRANESHQTSRNKTPHLRLASLHLLAPAARDAAIHPRALARNARRASAQLRPPRAGIAPHRYFRRLFPPRRTAHARKKIEVDSLHSRGRRAADVSRTPRLGNRRHQPQRCFLSANGRAHHRSPPRARARFPRLHAPSRPLSLGPARHLGQAATPHRT